MIRRTFRLATLLAPLFALGCGDAGRDAGAGRVATFDEAFATTGTIRLHESDSVLNVEVRDAPELLHVEPRDGSFTFVDPSADAPNRWLTARLRDR